jgi:dTDP-4-amino-4,6-dideoxygalactose transaminase
MPDPISLPRDEDATGRDLGAEELALLAEVIKSGTLTETKGRMVRRLEAGFAEMWGVPHCMAMSSGSASIHTAIAAINPEPGDEVITTPITDMGALTPILYQGAIPVFADVDPDTFNVTAATIEPRVTDRTRAIIVTHLFGNPCDMEAIMALAARRGIPVIEDCAQAFLATWNGRLVGRFGAMGCFSLQQGKHMTCGEGGLLITDDASLARRVRQYVNKAWGYGDPKPDHYFLALNYRMSELQGAVALAQLGKVRGVVERRRRIAAEMDAALKGLPGIETPVVRPGATHVYWKYPIQVDESMLGVDVGAFAARLKERGLVVHPRYIQKPAFMCEVFRDRRTLGASGFPFVLPGASVKRQAYDPAEYPGAMRALSRVIVVPMNEFYTAEHIQFICSTIREAVDALVGGVV